MDILSQQANENCAEFYDGSNVLYRINRFSLSNAHTKGYVNFQECKEPCL